MMKNEKLELLLNKVVEYNDPKAYKGKGCHFKAFLYKYKNKEGHYFKLIEVMAGSDLAFDDIIPLKKGDEKFLIVADKPKLMRVSRKSWHYRLMKYVLQSNTPTPKNMQNGCPYFWLLIFSILAVSFKLLFLAVKWVILLIPKGLYWVLGQLVNDWIASLDDEAAYDLYWDSGNSKMPKTAKIFFKNSDDKFFNFFLSRKHKDVKVSDEDFMKKRDEIRLKWEVWQKELNEKRQTQRAIDAENRAKRAVIRREQDRLREISRQKWEARMKPVYDGFNSIGAWLVKTFTVERGRINMIVKRTKQFIGLIATLCVLLFTFFVVTLLAQGIMIVVDALIVGWMYIVIVLCLLAAVGIIFLIYILISSWLQKVVNKYKRGRKVWYIEPLIYLIWYPVKYITISIAFLVVKIIFIPIKFIFYTLIFKYFLKPIGIFIVKVVVGLVKGIGSSSGIFGEYFGASYSDYCPGLEWCDFEEE